MDDLGGKNPYFWKHSYSNIIEQHTQPHPKGLHWSIGLSRVLDSDAKKVIDGSDQTLTISRQWERVQGYIQTGIKDFPHFFTPDFWLKRLDLA